MKMFFDEAGLPVDGSSAPPPSSVATSKSFSTASFNILPEFPENFIGVALEEGNSSNLKLKKSRNQTGTVLHKP